MAARLMTAGTASAQPQKASTTVTTPAAGTAATRAQPVSTTDAETVQPT
jgi:hypothetical protein